MQPNNQNKSIEDIAHRQVSESSTAQLVARKRDIETRHRYGFPLPILDELHKINSELYCRERGITSQPWITYVESPARSTLIEETP